MAASLTRQQFVDLINELNNLKDGQLQGFITRHNISTSKFGMIITDKLRLHLYLYLMMRSPYFDLHMPILESLRGKKDLRLFVELAVYGGYIKRPSFPTEHFQFLSYDQVVTAFRTRTFGKLTKWKIELTFELYRFLYPGIDSMFVCDMFPTHPMEAIVLQDHDIRHNRGGTSNSLATQVRRMISYFGMIIPWPNNLLEHDLEQYMAGNLRFYAKILLRGNLQVIPNERLVLLNDKAKQYYLQQLKDIEIFDTIGVLPLQFSSREQLINESIRLLSNTTPEILIINRKRAKYHSINSETVSGTNINDESVYMLGFGNAIKYHTYELDDLLASFYTDSTTGITAFRRPDNPNLVFNGDQIEDIERLLHRLTLQDPNNASANNLATRIQVIKRLDLSYMKYFADTTRKIATLSPNQRSLVREFLRSIFYTGMYMRRWSGPPHPYPLVESDTRCQTAPDIPVSQNLQIGKGLLARMTPDTLQFIQNLRAIQYTYGGEAQVQNQSFFVEWQGVWSGTHCIRMASTVFVGTGYHYLIRLFDETIPGMTRAPARIQ